MIADPIADLLEPSPVSPFGNLHSATGNNAGDAKSRSERTMPRPLICKKAAYFSSNFLGVTPAPQYSLNLATNNLSVKPTDTGQRYTSGVQSPNAGLWTSDFTLLNFDCCTRIRELLSDGLGFLFGDAFLDRLRSCFNEILRLF